METLWGMPKELVDLALGAGIGGLALLFPFRKVDARPDRAWDLIGLVAGIGFAVLVRAACERAMEAAWAAGLLETWGRAVYARPWWLVLPIYFVLADLGGYLTHRLMHTKLLWPSHAWHHSSPHVSWVSGLRGSPLHVWMLLTPYYLLGFLLPYEAPVSVASAVSVFVIVNQHYIHSNLRFPFTRALEWVFVTPRAHFVHHSAYIPRTDSNYGFVFSIWDRLFGTWTPPDDVPEDDELGLDYDAVHWRLLLGLPTRIPRAPRRDPPDDAHDAHDAELPELATPLLPLENRPRIP